MPIVEAGDVYSAKVAVKVDVNREWAMYVALDADSNWSIEEVLSRGYKCSEFTAKHIVRGIAEMTPLLSLKYRR